MNRRRKTIGREDALCTTNMFTTPAQYYSQFFWTTILINYFIAHIVATTMTVTTLQVLLTQVTTDIADYTHRC